MSAKSIRRDASKCQERIHQLEGELGLVQTGPRSKQDALAALDAAVDELAGPFQAKLRHALIGEPPPAPLKPHHSDPASKGWKPEPWRPQINYQGMLGKDLATTLQFASGSDWFHFLAWSSKDPLKNALHGIIDSLPSESFGMGQAERDKKQSELERDLQKIQAELRELEAAWRAEVGEDVDLAPLGESA